MATFCLRLRHSVQEVEVRWRDRGTFSPLCVASGLSILGSIFKTHEAIWSCELAACILLGDFTVMHDTGRAYMAQVRLRAELQRFGFRTK